MMAVVGIMLVLMVTAFGVFSTFAQRAGPDTAVSTVQAMLNGARDYAASNGVIAAIHFKGDLTKPENGTAMTLCYTADSTTWTDVRGRGVITLGPNMYACRDLPNTLAAFSAGNKQTEADLATWKTQEEANLLGPSGRITQQATAANLDFYVAFDPAGYLRSATGSSLCATLGVTVVQLFQAGSGRARTVAFALYPFNSMSGTRLVFD
jgi:hypothetical protein